MFRVPVPVTAACLLAAAPGLASTSVGDGGEYRIAQLLIQQRVLVKVRRAEPALPRTPLRPVRWTEKKGPKCLPLDGFAGALIAQPDAIDLVTDGGARFRARLDDDCAAVDFYASFYFKPTRDGRVCADRDALHSRAGRSCRIDSFRRLVAKR